MAKIKALEIVAAKPVHVDALTKLHRLAMRSPWSLKQWQDVFGDRYSVFAVFVSNEMVACAVFHLIIDELELQTIAVHPEHQGKGIAKQLLEFGIRAANAAEKVFLEVDDSNDRAVKLYRLNGFEVTAKRKAYYANSLGSGDALLMTKVIKERL